MNERGRRMAVGIGIGTLAGGLLLISTGNGGRSGDITGVLYAIGGLFGAVMTYLTVRSWLPSDVVDVPEVERPTTHPRPGTTLDKKLAQFEEKGRGNLQDRNALHRRLADLAVAVLARRGDYSDDEARQAIESGDWCEDPKVIAFLRNPNATLARSWVDRVSGIGRNNNVVSDFQELFRRTVDRLAELTEASEAGSSREESVIVRLPDEDFDNRRFTTQLQDDLNGNSGESLGVVSTERWKAVIPAALSFLGFGFLLQRAALVFAGAVAIGFTVYALAFVPPTTPPRIERSIDTEEAAPGDRVEITLSIHNESSQRLPDLRIIDGVPAGLTVTDGSPRHGTTLSPGGSTEFTYSVTARRGVHEFGPAFVIVRDYAGSTARVGHVPIEDSSDISLLCIPSLNGLPVTIPLYTRPGEYLGRIPAGGGEGVEFHSTREYRPGDSTTRIDWKRLARSTNNELTTVRFREERVGTVAMVVDTDPGAYLAPEPEHPGTVERSIEAAGRLSGSLLDAGDRVGIAALGPKTTWLEPSIGADQRRRIERLLATDTAFPPTPPVDKFYPRWAREFHRRFPDETQAVLFSPLCENRTRIVINQLRSYGHPVTVISPDPTAGETVGQRFLRLERWIRIVTLRESGVRVVDWDMEEDLSITLNRAASRWSR